MKCTVYVILKQCSDPDQEWIGSVYPDPDPGRPLWYTKSGNTRKFHVWRALGRAGGLDWTYLPSIQKDMAIFGEKKMFNVKQNFVSIFAMKTLVRFESGLGIIIHSNLFWIRIRDHLGSGSGFRKIICTLRTAASFFTCVNSYNFLENYLLEQMLLCRGGS